MLQELIEQLQHAQRAIKENGQLEVEVNTLEETITGLKNELERKEEKIKELRDELETLDTDCVEYENEDFVGLDKIKWSLESGNLEIQQRMESFIESLQKEFSVSAVSY